MKSLTSPSRVIYFESNNESFDEEVEELDKKLEKLRIFEEQVNSSNSQNENGGNNQRDNKNSSSNQNNNSNSSGNSGNSESPREVRLPQRGIAEKIDLTAEVIQRINTAESVETNTVQSGKKRDSKLKIEGFRGLQGDRMDHHGPCDFCPSKFHRIWYY